MTGPTGTTGTAGTAGSTDTGLAAAGAADAIAGVPARHVAAPATIQEAAAAMRAAAAGGLAVVARGSGGRQDWAAPPRRLDLVLDTARLAGVVEHAAGDLIAVVRAGTPVAQVQAALAEAGQQLALDTPPGATVGGVVAVNASGPRRLAYGTVRDLLIGVTVVRADGVVARAGGKVVKNVAGYDLGKLMTGSYGTLAVIAECAFRLHPLPPTVAYVRRAVGDAGELGRLLAAVRAAQVVPSAVEVDAGPAPAAGMAAPIALTVLVEGTALGVAGRVDRLRRLLGEVDVSDGPPDGWAAYPWRAGEVGLRLTGALSRVPSLLAGARAAADRRGAALRVRGSAGVGVLYAGLPAEPGEAAADTAADTAAGLVADLRAAATAAGGHAVVLTAPPAVRDRVDLWGPVPGLDLMRRVKEQFDPDARLAPGRFVGGI
jgi:glycolate oxidase FAD binding subunit